MQKLPESWQKKGGDFQQIQTRHLVLVQVATHSEGPLARPTFHAHIQHVIYLPKSFCLLRALLFGSLQEMTHVDCNYILQFGVLLCCRILISNLTVLTSHGNINILLQGNSFSSDIAKELQICRALSQF